MTDLAARRIWTERYVLAVSSDDPLANKRFVGLKDLAGRAFLAFDRATQPTLYDIAGEPSVARPRRPGK